MTGFPKGAVRQNIGKVSNPLEFVTANGFTRSSKAIGMRSGILGPHGEVNLLKDAPFCAAMGELVYGLQSLRGHSYFRVRVIPTCHQQQILQRI